MGRFTVKEIRLYRVAVPLRKPFSTHLQTVAERECIFVEMTNEAGIVGLGECVAFTSPWYTEETIQTCWDALVNWLIPSLIGKVIKHPEEIGTFLAYVKGNRMAKAALDQAAWDLFAKKQGQPLWQLLGGKRKEVDAGIVLTGEIDDGMYAAVQTAVTTGYKRVKVKIDGQTNPAKLKKLVHSFHEEVFFFADGNGIFDTLGLEALLRFDEVGLTLIEQPFGEDAWEQHRMAAKRMTTPIALDESIRSLADVERMIEREAGAIIVLKPGRVGGITESLKIHRLAEENNLPVWIGGMIEFGVSKAHNLALASLPQMTLPGDFSASTHFWHEDPVEPANKVEDGVIVLSDEPGIGYRINHHIIKKYVQDSRLFQ